MTLYDDEVREYALKVQYGTMATKMMVPSAFSGKWEKATFCAPEIWYAGLFYENKWMEGGQSTYYTLDEVPGSIRFQFKNEDANWEFRDRGVFNKIDWGWEMLRIQQGVEYRISHVLLFDSPSSLTAWEIIKLSATIKVTDGTVVEIPA